MSRKPYECFRCRDNGFPGVQVYLAGKDNQNKTVYVEENGHKHIHKTKEQQQQQDNNKNNPLAPVSDESVERGISAFTMMSDLTVLVEQNQKLLVTLDSKMDRLLSLTCAQQQKQVEK